VRTGLADEADIRGEESLTQDSCLYDTLLLLCPERCYCRLNRQKSCVASSFNCIASRT